MTATTEVKDSTTNLPEKKQDTNTQETTKTEAQKPPVETQEELNWRKFRSDREKERKAKEESDRRAQEKEAEANALKAAMEALVNKPQQQQYGQQEDKSEDQIIEEKVNAIIAKDRKNQENERLQREAAELPQRLNQTYNDFNHVCTQENLDYLEYHYPEVAGPYKHLANSFEKWANLYKAVKRFVPNPESKKEQAKVEKNLNKPQSMSIPGSTQTGDHAPSQLTEQRQKDNWARMQRTMKGMK